MNNKLRVIEVLYGREFNLKHHKYLVVRIAECGKEHNDEVKGWVEMLRNLMQKNKALGYFEKLDLWYQKQFEKTFENKE